MGNLMIWWYCSCRGSRRRGSTDCTDDTLTYLDDSWITIHGMVNVLMLEHCTGGIVHLDRCDAKVRQILLMICMYLWSKFGKWWICWCCTGGIVHSVAILNWLYWWYTDLYSWITFNDNVDVVMLYWLIMFMLW